MVLSRLTKKEIKCQYSQKIWINIVYAIFLETPYEEIKYLKQLMEIDDQLPMVIIQLGDAYTMIWINMIKQSLNLKRHWKYIINGISKPMWIYNYTFLGNAYHKTGQYKKEKKLYKKAEQDFPDDPDIITDKLFFIILKEIQLKQIDYIEKYISIRKENSHLKQI